MCYERKLLKIRIAVLALVLLFCEGGNAWWLWVRRRRRPSPVHCRVSAWSDWGACSKTCGGGKAIRTRYITRHAAHGGHGCPGLRQTKICQNQSCPVPVTCQWSSWSAWSSCDPCFPGGRSRARNISVPAMFHGAQCPGSRSHADYSCTTVQPCNITKCPTKKFSCYNGVLCVSKLLLCNGDNDCTDHSDEKHCSNVTIHPPCGKEKYKGIPNIDIAGAGFDIIKLREEGRIMDNDKYNGLCSTVRSGDIGKRFRKPGNVQFYRFQVHVDTSFTTKSYESSMSYFQDKRSSYESKLDSSVSLSYPKVFSLSAKSSGSNSRKTRMVINFGTNSDSKFFKISSTIQVAQFRMVRHILFFSYEFLQRLKQLPDDFDYAKYAQVISDFGTHFYSRGVLGGKYEYVYRYSKKALLQSGLSDIEQKSCLNEEASFSFLGIAGIGGGSSKCSSNKLSQKHKGSFTRSASNVVSNVVGGSSVSAAALSFLTGKTPNKTDYNKWVETVKHNPAVIDYTLSPISSAVPLSSYKKRKNMDRALVQYLKEYDSSKCKGKCANGAGVVVVNGGKLCKCLCAANYGGIDCNVHV